MAIQKYQRGQSTPSWIESKITMISEKDRGLYLEFCGEISHLGLKNRARAKDIWNLASKALVSQLGATAIDSLRSRERKVVLIAFGELQPDFPLDEGIREFVPFLAHHRIINPNLVDIHGIKKNAWLDSEYPNAVFPKLISTTVCVVPQERSISRLAELMSVFIRSVKREPRNDRKRDDEGVTTGIEELARAAGT